LTQAELIDGLCQRYGCLPSQLMEEDAQVLQMVAIVQLGQPEQETVNGE
jgi:pyruvate/2-oxoglutarate dehydrogenase complex dihydrolipoamide dehydrogenase (E3) component